MAWVYDILKGRFLTDEGSSENWRFIIFITALAMFMIYTGHALEKKTFQLAKLSEEVESLRSEYYDMERQIMFIQMESEVARRLADKGIAPAKHPPKQIVVKKTSDE